MILVLRLLVILSCSTIASGLIAQSTTQYYTTHQSVKFRPGVYVKIDMVKRNRPIPSTWIETDMDVTHHDFYANITKADEIIFFDDNGVRTSIPTDSIWGYSHNGDLHINIYGDFHRIDYVGRISHFIALKSTLVEFEIKGRRPWNIHYLTFEAVVKNKGYLVDLVDDKVSVFDVAGLEQVLKEDPQLWNEFMALKKRKKEKLKYVFLTRYNEKFPLDIPF